MAKTELMFRLTSKPTFRDLRGRFTKANEQLLQDRRQLVRDQGKRFVKLAIDEAPERTGKFKKSIRYKTFVEGNGVGFTVTTKQPLGTFIVRGTKAHVIPARRAPALRFWWDKGPRGPDIYYFKSVNHPGTKPNKFISRAYRRWIPGARSDLRRISTRFARHLGGSTD